MSYSDSDSDDSPEVVGVNPAPEKPARAEQEVVDLLSDDSDVEDVHASAVVIPDGCRSTAACQNEAALARTSPTMRQLSGFDSRRSRKGSDSTASTQASGLKPPPSGAQLCNRTHKPPHRHQGRRSRLTADVARNSAPDPPHPYPDLVSSTSSVQPDSIYSSLKPAAQQQKEGPNKRLHNHISKGNKDRDPLMNYSSQNHQNGRNHRAAATARKTSMSPGKADVDLCQTSDSSDSDSSVEYVRTRRHGDSVDNAIVLLGSDEDDDSDIDILPPPAHQAAAINRARAAMSEQQQKQVAAVPPVKNALPYDSSDDDMAMLHERDQLNALLKYGSPSPVRSIVSTDKASPSSPFPAEVEEQRPSILPPRNLLQSPPAAKRGLKAPPHHGGSEGALARSRSQHESQSNAKSRQSQEKRILKHHVESAPADLVALKPERPHLSAAAKGIVLQLKRNMQSNTTGYTTSNDGLVRKPQNHESQSIKRPPEMQQSLETNNLDDILRQSPETTAQEPGEQSAENAPPPSDKSMSGRSDADGSSVAMLEDAVSVAESGGTACLADLSTDGRDDESYVSGGTVALDPFDVNWENHVDAFSCGPRELPDTLEQVRIPVPSLSRTNLDDKLWEEETLESSLLAAYEPLAISSDRTRYAEYDSDDEPKPAKNARDTPPVLVEIDHLTKWSVSDDRGLPVKDFAVHDDSKGVLYYFRIQVEESSIPGADHGAFITFLGASKLNAKAAAQLNAEMTRRVVNNTKPEKPLQVESPYGFGASVTVTGEHLFGKNNADYLLPEDFNYEPSGMESHPCTNGRIGPLKLHVEADYVPDPGIQFSGESNSVFIGRYGPFRRQDRKTDQLYTIKNCIFEQGPAEYAFAVDEELCHRVQAIDITSDETGLPHEVARSNIPMYVNEIAYSDREQNVFNVQDDGSRSVLYYFVTPRPLKTGEKVELFTTYFDSYEKMRQQKGYGLQNLKGTALSCDESRATKLEHDFEERDITEKVIHDCREAQRLFISEITDILEYLLEHMWKPLEQAERTSQLTCRQLVAMRRIQWVTESIRKRIDEDEENYLSCDPSKHHGYPFAPTFKYCRDLIRKMKWKNLGRTLEVSDCYLDPEGKNVRGALIEEVTHEILYGLRDKLPMAFNKSFWCPIAMTLIDKLCEAVCVDLLAAKSDSEEGARVSLKEKLFDAAAAAKVEINLAIRDPSQKEALVFESGLHEFVGYRKEGPLYLTASLMETFSLGDCTSSSFFLDNSILPKGLLALTAEKLAYYDSLVAADLEPLSTDFAVPLDVDGKFLMFEQSDFTVSNEKLRKLGATARSLSSSSAQSAMINETWYIVWQIVFPVHAVARKYLDEDEYSFEMLCDKLGVDPVLAEFAIGTGIKEVKSLSIKRFLTTTTRTDLSTRARSRRGQAGSKGVMAEPSKGRSNTKKKEKKKKCAQSRGSGGIESLRPAAKVIYEGPPTKPLDWPGGWPPGWCERTYARMSGDSKGHTDSYWYTPNLQRKLRSISNVKKFLGLLKDNGGDEDLAYMGLKTK